MQWHLFVVCRKLFKGFWNVLSVGSRERKIKDFSFRVSVNKQGFLGSRTSPNFLVLGKCLSFEWEILDYYTFQQLTVGGLLSILCSYALRFWNTLSDLTFNRLLAFLNGSCLLLNCTLGTVISHITCTRTTEKTWQKNFSFQDSYTITSNYLRK